MIGIFGSDPPVRDLDVRREMQICRSAAAAIQCKSPGFVVQFDGVVVLSLICRDSDLDQLQGSLLGLLGRAFLCRLGPLCNGPHTTYDKATQAFSLHNPTSIFLLNFQFCPYIGKPEKKKKLFFPGE